MKRVLNNELQAQLNRIEHKIDIASLIAWFFFGMALIIGAISLSKYLGFYLTLSECAFGLIVMVVALCRYFKIKQQKKPQKTKTIY